MKKIQLSSIILGLLVLILIDACRKPEDMFPEADNMVESIDLDGSLAAPLVDTKLGFINFIPEGDSLLWMEIDDNKLVHLRMYYKNVVSVKMKEIYPLLSFPIDASGFPVPSDSLKVKSDTSKMKVYGRLLEGRLHFDDPRIKFRIRNQIPIVTFYRLDSVNMYDSNLTPISHTEDTIHTINTPQAEGEVALDSILIDKNRIRELPVVFSPVPKYIGFNITVGSEQNQVIPFAVTGEESIEIDADVDLPLEARLENLLLGDTVDFGDFEDDEYDYVKSVTLKMEFENGFPAKAVSQVYITDTTDTGEIGQKLDSLFTDTSIPDISQDGWTFEAAETDASGLVTEKKKTFVIVELDRDRWQRLKDRHAAKIIIGSHLDSYKSDQGLDIRILSHYKLGVKIALKANIEYTLETTE